jgi:hypothetical protein
MQLTWRTSTQPLVLCTDLRSVIQRRNFVEQLIGYE